MSPRSVEAITADARDGAPFSNSTEYDEWSAHWCALCSVDDLDDGGAGCPLLLVAMSGKTPAEWFEVAPLSLANRYQCVEFRSADGDGDPEPRPLPEPDQSGLFARPARAVRMLRQPRPVEVRP